MLSQFGNETIFETEKPFVGGENHFTPKSIFTV